MGYLAVWKVQEKMIAELRKAGVAIPDGIMSDLRTARSLISIPQTDQPSVIEVYLTNVESFIITQSEKHLGAKLANEWLNKLGHTGKTADKPEDITRFIPGIPRGKKWMRIKPTEELPAEALKYMVNGLELSYRVQHDGYLLVYGENKPLKNLVRLMAQKQSPRQK